MPTPVDSRTEPMSPPVHTASGDTAPPDAEATTKPTRSDPPVVPPRVAGKTEDVPVESLLRGIDEPQPKPKPKASAEALAAGAAAASHEAIAPRARTRTEPEIPPVQLAVTQPTPDEPIPVVPHAPKRTPAAGMPAVRPSTPGAAVTPAPPAASSRNAPPPSAPAVAAPPAPRRREAQTLRIRPKKKAPVGTIVGVILAAGAAGGLLALALRSSGPDAQPQAPARVVDTNPTAMPGEARTAAVGNATAAATWVAVSASASASPLASALGAGPAASASPSAAVSASATPAASR